MLKKRARKKDGLVNSKLRSLLDGNSCMYLLYTSVLFEKQENHLHVILQGHLGVSPRLIGSSVKRWNFKSWKRTVNRKQ